MKKNYNNDPKILKDFLYYMRNVKNYSEKTISEYRLDLLLFFRFLQHYLKLDINIRDFNIFILKSVKEADIIAFFIYLNFTRDDCAATRERKKASIKCFFKWLCMKPKNDLQINPAQDLPYIRKTARIPKYLNLSQAKKICNIFNTKNSDNPLRNNTMILLFLNTGLRISELSNININDINFQEKTIQVIGKGNKERIVFLNQFIIEQLQYYIRIENQKNNLITIDSPLFLNNRKERLGTQGIAYIIKKAYKLSGLEQYNYTTHTLRHTFATMMYESLNGNILMLQKLLGHTSIESTEIYTHINDEKIRNAFNSNPLNEIA